MKPTFKVDGYLQGVYNRLQSKSEKPEFGNDIHIKAVRYHEDKQDFIEKLKDYCEKNNLDEERELAEALPGEYMIKYEVTVEYRGTKTYEIEALSPEEAEDDALDRFNDESISSLDPITDCEVE